MQGSCRHSLHFSFFCFLFLPPTPDFLSLLFLSFFPPFLLSSVLFLTVICFSLSPPLSFRISTSQSLLHFCDFFGSFSTCPSLLGSPETASRGRAPEPTPLELSSHRGLPAQVPAGQQHRSFPPSPRPRSLCPQLPRNLQEETPEHNAAHSVAYPLGGGHLTHLLQTLLILTLEDSLDFSSHPQTSRLGNFQRLTPSPQPQRPHLGPGQAAAAPGTLHTACRSPRRYIPTWASKHQCQRAH